MLLKKINKYIYNTFTMNKKFKIDNNSSLFSPSSWIENNLSKNSSKMSLLDLACGNGRHSVFAANAGYQVTSIDIDKSKLISLKNNKFINPIQVDLEINNPWPFRNEIFDVVLVTNYLYRPIFKYILNSIKLNGKLFYETFTEENIIFGKPNNKNFLLKPQELLNYARSNRFKVINYEEIIISKPIKKAVQRIYAIKK